MRILKLCAVFMLAVSCPAIAAEKLFEIVRTDGSVQPVTDEDVKSIGEHTLTTPLIGQNDGEHKVSGPLFRDVLAHFQVNGEIADVAAIDAYRIDVPIQDFKDYDVIIATTVDGERLRIRDRGPAWIVYPLKDHPELKTPIYEARSVWQVEKIRMK